MKKKTKRTKKTISKEKERAEALAKELATAKPFTYRVADWGMIEVSAILRGFRIARQYQGYTKREATKDFTIYITSLLKD